jgi:hypothetical protein
MSEESSSHLQSSPAAIVDDNATSSSCIDSAHDDNWPQEHVNELKSFVKSLNLTETEEFNKQIGSAFQIIDWKKVRFIPALCCRSSICKNSKNS